eukprot:scaffold1503_cov250-Pinguiococcus_pyrenoidosus.AAC.20
MAGNWRPGDPDRRQLPLRKTFDKPLHKDWVRHPRSNRRAIAEPPAVSAVLARGQGKRPRRAALGSAPHNHNLWKQHMGVAGCRPKKQALAFGRACEESSQPRADLLVRRTSLCLAPTSSGTDTPRSTHSSNLPHFRVSTRSLLPHPRLDAPRLPNCWLPSIHSPPVRGGHCSTELSKGSAEAFYSIPHQSVLSSAGIALNGRRSVARTFRVFRGSLRGFREAGEPHTVIPTTPLSVHVLSEVAFGRCVWNGANLPELRARNGNICAEDRAHIVWLHGGDFDKHRCGCRSPLSGRHGQVPLSPGAAEQRRGICARSAAVSVRGRGVLP